MSPLSTEAYTFVSEEQGTDLTIFGLGMLRLNYATVEGDARAFESSDDGYAEDFDTGGFLSLNANGILFHEFALEGFARYDEEDDPDLNFLFTLSRDKNFLMFGDQPAVLPENYYARYASPLRGLTMHLESEKIGVTTFGAVTRGETLKEEFRPDGTSGPYRLESPPLVPGSEMIYFEIRNRNDLKQILEKIPQERNVDYVIDYDDGKITFTKPVDSETFRGDPVFIIAIYRSEEESSDFNTSLAGGRAFANPVERVSIGASYVSEFDRESAFSEAFDARQDIYSVDGALKIGADLLLRSEYAISQDHQNPDNDASQAFLATLDGTIGRRFSISSRYHRNDRDFLTFANPAIYLDEQIFEFDGKYAFLTDHSLDIGYSYFQDNLAEDKELPTTTTHRPYIGWESFFGERTNVYSRYEFIKNDDDLSPRQLDDQTHIFLVGGEHEFPSVPVAKRLELLGEYQFDDFEDNTDFEADTRGQHLRVRALVEPFRQVKIYVEQKERFFKDKGSGDSTDERQDISEIGLELGYWERFTLNTKYQYRRDRDLLLDIQSAERHVFNLSADYQPFESFQAYGRFEYRNENRREPETDLLPLSNASKLMEFDSRAMVLEGRLLYTPHPDLTFRLRYEYDDTIDEDEFQTETMEDELEIRANYSFDQRRTRLTASMLIERDLLNAPPSPEAETRTTTYLLSGARKFGERWDVLAQYKREVVALSADNYREDISGELGWELNHFIKFVGGYQYTNFQDEQNHESDYLAHSLYLRLVGRL